METDNFNRADGDLGANWAEDEGSWAIVSNEAVSGAVSAQNIARWIGSSFTTNHYSEVIVPGVPSEGGPATRVAASQAYLLMARTQPTSTWQLYRYDGSYTSIAGPTAGAAGGDEFRLASEDSTHKVYRNTVQQGSDITDATFTTGGIGMQTFSAHALENWEGGDLAVATRIFLNA